MTEQADQAKVDEQFKAIFGAEMDGECDIALDSWLELIRVWRRERPEPATQGLLFQLLAQRYVPREVALAALAAALFRLTEEE